MPPDEDKLERAQLGEREYNQLKTDLVATFTTPHGRRVFWYLLLAGHYVGPVCHPKNALLARLAAERDFVQDHLFMPMADADPGLLADIITAGLREQTDSKE